MSKFELGVIAEINRDLGVLARTVKELSTIVGALDKRIGVLEQDSLSRGHLPSDHAAFNQPETES